MERARFYSAEYGRFLSVDPMENIFFGWSPYSYVLGNPVSLTDPDGRMPGGPVKAQLAEDGVPITYTDGMTITAGTASPSWAKQAAEAYVSGVTQGPFYPGGNHSGIGTIQITAEGAELALDILGSSEIPIISQLADFGAAAFAIYQGDLYGAGLSVGAAIPIAGGFFAMAKFSRRTKKIAEWTSKNSTYIDDIPALDHTGKLHGKLPKRSEWANYSKEDLEILLGDLKKSVVKRDQVNKSMGVDYGHSRRLADEHELIQDIEKHLGKR
ncbi:MAG: RHS repeat-associated core domain-containing protein [Bacteroidota bacterium]